MDRKNELKNCFEVNSIKVIKVKQVAVSTLQEKQILQNCRVLSTKWHEYTSPFIPLH